MQVWFKLRSLLFCLTTCLSNSQTLEPPKSLKNKTVQSFPSYVKLATNSSSVLISEVIYNYPQAIKQKTTFLNQLLACICRDGGSILGTIWQAFGSLFPPKTSGRSKVVARLLRLRLFFALRHFSVPI